MATTGVDFPPYMLKQKLCSLVDTLEVHLYAGLILQCFDCLHRYLSTYLRTYLQGSLPLTRCLFGLDGAVWLVCLPD